MLNKVRIPPDIKKEKVKPGDILVGEPLPRDVFDEAGVLLLKKDCLIESQRQLDALLTRGLYFITLWHPAGRTPEAPAIKIKKTIPFELVDGIYVQLSTLFSIQNINKNFSSRVIEVATSIQNTCQLDADASLGAIFLSKERSYFITHQIHCAIICDIILKYLGLSPPERLPVLAAALTMNISMVELQDILFKQKERLNEEQQKKVQIHPQQGAELLRAYGVTDEAWLTTVLQHHEFIDGSGYPQGLRDEAISQNARILTLADVYCAKLSPRAYRIPLSPNVASRELFSNARGQFFDQDLARSFIKILGIFHPGSFVRLANGEIALVTYRGEKIHHPIVHSVINTNGVPRVTPKQRDCSIDQYAITDSIAPEKVKVTINKLLVWGYWEFS
jgi:HD-GYP domain-containing protein (c-di-GMP phosphodiesterase class II)